MANMVLLFYQHWCWAGDSVGSNLIQILYNGFTSLYIVFIDEILHRTQVLKEVLKQGMNYKTMQI
jgi:hypothetical protein